MTEHESIRPSSERGRPQTWAHWWNCNYRYALKSAIVSRGDNEAPFAKRLASDTDLKHMFPPAAQQK